MVNKEFNELAKNVFRVYDSVRKYALEKRVAAGLVGEGVRAAYLQKQNWKADELSSFIRDYIIKMAEELRSRGLENLAKIPDTDSIKKEELVGIAELVLNEKKLITNLAEKYRITIRKMENHVIAILDSSELWDEYDRERIFAEKISDYIKYVKFRGKK